ncbi:MAG: CoA transferase [Gemmatimonadota bacterium]|jgi:crotonobetainyl-CoA:carnitine CoA-transferase CaiB-like acyl-CoA transferase
MSTVLEGIRVLDFGRYIAGPYCASLLGDMGADVIRVEKRRGSEDRWTSPVAEGGEGALFMQVNRNKRGITLNPMKEEGREVVRRLVATADVVVANLPPQTLQRMGLDYATLVETKPDIILSTVSAYGHGGPWSHRVGFDGVAQAMSGAMYLTGDGEEPMRLYYPWVDFTTAILTAYGTMAALMERQKTGKGQQVEGALLMSALTVGNGTLIEQDVIQPNRVATGNRGQIAAPSDLFRTKDGWVLVMVIGEPLFERWARLMGEDHWLEDPRFEDDISRGNHGEIISERMARWCETRTTDECLAALDEARIPAGPVLSPQQALDHPHVQAMKFMLPVDYPGLPRPAPVADTPVRLSETPGGVRQRAPVLGEHTEEVLGEIGYDASAIAALRDSGVV